MVQFWARPSDVAGHYCDGDGDCRPSVGDAGNCCVIGLGSTFVRFGDTFLIGCKAQGFDAETPSGGVP